MKKIYLILVLVSIIQLKTHAQETSNDLSAYGKVLLESLKESDSHKFFGLSMTIVDYVNTTLAKTQNEEVRNNIINELLKEDPKNKKWEKESKKRFDQVKQNNEINWQKAEFIDFKFEKDDKKSKDLNFIMGSASLFFKANGKQYEFKIDKFGKLESGWKGFEYHIEVTESKSVKSYETFGKSLLECLKESDPEKLLALCLTISEFKKTVKAKTPQKNKAKFFAEVEKEKDESLKKMVIESFKTLTLNKKINWQNTEYVDFIFERQKERSDNLGFDWGKGVLVFNDTKYQYHLKISEMSQLLSGWKGIGYRFSKRTEISPVKSELETYGKAFFEVLKTDDYDKLYSLCMSGEDLVNTVNEKTQIKEIKTQITEQNKGITIEKWQGFIKRKFDRAKQKYPINWADAEYLEFKFEKNEGDSQDINFAWGKAILYFMYDNQKYKFKFGEFAYLLTGWKGNNFRLELD